VDSILISERRFLEEYNLGLQKTLVNRQERYFRVVEHFEGEFCKCALSRCRRCISELEGLEEAGGSPVQGMHQDNT